MGHHHHHHIVLEDHEKEPVKIATIIGIISVILNLLLGITKIVIGRIASSSAVFSDGVHGTGDVLTTVIAVISVWIAAKKKNKKYNYGYERYASIACLVLAVILFLTAGEIIVESTESLIAGISGEQEETLTVFSELWWVSFSVASLSILVKAVMFFITMYGAKKAGSNAMKADAWHQVIDALSSVAALIALFGYLWLPDNNILDPIFTYPIAFMVIYVGYETFVTAVRELSDHAIDEELMNEVKEVIYTVVKPEEVRLIHSRIFSEKFYLDIYLLLDSSLSLAASDEIADQIKAALFDKFDNMKNAYVIIEPDDEKHRHQIEGGF